MTLFLICLAIPLFLYLLSEFYIKENFTKWLRVPVFTGMIGIEVAARLLERHGLKHIKIELINGELTDHYDGEKKTICLSKDVYYGNSVASIAVLAHEIGHALQDSTNYRLYCLTREMRPIAMLAGSVAPIFFIFGLMVWKWMIGIAVFCVLFVLFVQVLVLLVEWDASRRAKQILVEGGFIGHLELFGVNQTLSATAFTYVAALFRFKS
jgi:uncharacterized protein